MKNRCESIPKKLEILSEYFSSIRFANTAKILDVGGTRFYYHMLEDIFKSGEVYLLNINPDDVKGIRSFIGDATKLPFKDES